MTSDRPNEALNDADQDAIEKIVSEIINMSDTSYRHEDACSSELRSSISRLATLAVAVSEIEDGI